MTRGIPTQEELEKALSRDCFYGQVPTRVVVPRGYRGATMINGVHIDVEDDLDQAYVEPAEGGRLSLAGTELC